MFLRRFNKGTLISQLNLRLRFSTAVKAEPFETAETAENVEICDNLGIEEYRQRQLSRLESVKPADFSPIALNQLIGDFLVSPRKPDTALAGKLLDKFLFKIPEIDEKGDLVTLYLLQTVQNNEIAESFNFLKRLLQQSKESQIIQITPFMMECVWKGIIDSKEDSIGFDLLKAIKEADRQELITAEFTEQLIMELFLPRLNWPAIDYLVATASSEITISASTLREIFHVVLEPVANDPYYDPLESEPFTGNLVNPRFHRLLELLERWKQSGIPIKGKQISKALEDTFKCFLPTESMMNELQKLA